MTGAAASILIVDDEPQNCKLLDALLRAEGYRTQCAAGGEEALAAIARHPPDLVLLDMMMPGMDGCQVAAALKADAATASIPIIMVTALVDRSARLAGLEAGCEEFLTKPVDRSELWLRVRNLLRMKEYGDSLRKQGDLLEAQVQARTAELQLKVDALRRSNEELEQFAHVASHDLQEPLRMVASYTQLLSRRYAGKLDADADEFIAYAVDGATRMQHLIRDLLAYSSIGSRGSELAATSSEMALHNALLNLSGAIADNAALVTSDPLPFVLADEMLLAQLFQNLIGNAVKYHGAESPRVHVSAVAEGAGRWMFSVRDNGIGMDPQYHERIFGMFQRLHRREEFAGTGIGLAICRKIVERHGGSIQVESQAGQGATFRFSLSAVPEAR